MHVNCVSNENICEATIRFTFPCKQTIMMHDMKKFYLTQFECRIQKLNNMLENYANPTTDSILFDQKHEGK